jgi:hypothetical protein
MYTNNVSFVGRIALMKASSSCSESSSSVSLMLDLLWARPLTESGHDGIWNVKGARVELHTADGRGRRMLAV